jgi:hypothetical protein
MKALIAIILFFAVAIGWAGMEVVHATCATDSAKVVSTLKGQAPKEQFSNPLSWFLPLVEGNIFE